MVEVVVRVADEWRSAFNVNAHNLHVLFHADVEGLRFALRANFTVAFDVRQLDLINVMQSGVETKVLQQIILTDVITVHDAFLHPTICYHYFGLSFDPPAEER